jgi:hypothetical protein
MTSTPLRAALILTAVLPPLALASCSDPAARHAVARTVSGGASATPPAAAAVPPSAASAPPSAVAAPATTTTAAEVGELGPTAVRVLRVTRGPAGGVRLSIVGPDRARYGIRTHGGVRDACSQTSGVVDASALPGLPANAVRHAEISCGGVGSVREALTGMLTVRVPAGPGFTYDFELPARPRT